MSKTRDAVQGPDIAKVDGISHIEVAQDDLYLMLISSLRYAMGRSSYITGSTADAIRKYAKYLTDAEVETLHLDLATTILQVEGSGGYLGMEMDHKVWTSLQQWLEDHIESRGLS